MSNDTQQISTMDKGTELFLTVARGISALIFIIIAAIFIFDDVKATATTGIWVIGSIVVFLFTHTKLTESSNSQQTVAISNNQTNNNENSIMFCRTCGKELPAQAVACIGCGMNPKDGNKHCPSCGEDTEEKQVICTACGGSLLAENSAGWSDGAYIGLLILSFLLPIFGWIYGGIKANKAPEDSKQKKQAWHYIFAGFGGLVLNLMIM